MHLNAKPLFEERAAVSIGIIQRMVPAQMPSAQTVLWRSKHSIDGQGVNRLKRQYTRFRFRVVRPTSHPGSTANPTRGGLSLIGQARREL